MNNLTPTILKKEAPKSAYDFGNEFVNQLVNDYRKQVAELIKKHTNEDLSKASTETIKTRLKKLMKDQNVPFVTDLSNMLMQTRSKTNPVSINQRIKMPTRMLNSTGAVWSLGAEKYQEALKWLQKQGYTAEEAENIISDKGEDAPELKAWNEGKNAFDWNKAIESTGKVAQSIFYLGSIFSQKEDPAPTLTEAEQNTTKTTNSLSRNVIIGVIAVAVIATLAYFLIKSKK